MSLRHFFGAALVLFSIPAFALKTTGGLSAEQLAKALAGPAITITNAKITGAAAAIGTFSEGGADGLPIDSGVIMSTGDIASAAGPNVAQGTTGENKAPGDSLLDSLVSPFKTEDAVILEFDAVTTTSSLSIRYLFASEEYREYVGSEFNDVFAFFVDGQNIALVPGSTDPVSVNTINHLRNVGLYTDNAPGSNAFGISFDGFTSVLTAVALVTPNTSHHVRLAIADTSDAILDSAVFLAQGGVSGLGAGVVVPEILQVLLSNGEVSDMKVTVYGVPDDVTPQLFATGLPEDSTVTFTPAGQLGPNTPIYRMHIAIGPDTLAGSYPLTVHATLKNSEALGSVNVIVDCQPPLILGIPGNQPVNSTVAAGSTANLKVVPIGTSGFRYQWYQGHSGSTLNPIAGATSATLTTPKITSPTEFWVRVSNACGSIDSQTATVSTP
jgi:hypothetical protein